MGNNGVNGLGGVLGLSVNGSLLSVVDTDISLLGTCRRVINGGCTTGSPCGRVESVRELVADV
jgi:hypothetical protein